VIVASTLLNAGYFLPIVYRAFYRAPPAEDEHDDHDAHTDHHAEASSAGGGGAVAVAAPRAIASRVTIQEAPWPILVALSATAALTLTMFVWPDLPLGLAQRLAEILQATGAGS
jgi:multicomponent Na+:H+ antiporter subunit D